MTTASPPPSLSMPLEAKGGPWVWIRKNLFNNWFNGILTILIIGGLLKFLVGFAQWVFQVAQWEVIPANWQLYYVGRFPPDQFWRLWLMLLLITVLAGLSWGVLARQVSTLLSRPVLISLGVSAALAIAAPTPLPNRLILIGLLVVLVVVAALGQRLATSMPNLGTWVPLLWGLSFFVTLWLLLGGLGLKPVSTNDWGGLLLTVFLALVGMILCFPLGVLLALGRRSELLVVRWLSTLYIEVVRGVPLISILFMGQVMLPLFLPEGIRPDRVFRALAGLTLFSAAYMAENVRGGLQAIPRGQTEAANALGLNPLLTTGLIVLPQALKISIPAIVGQFISLFQDTTLLSIVGLLELLGMSRTVLANPAFLGRHAEVYLFIGVMYWLFCYTMSLASRRLEAALHTGQNR